MFKLLQRVNIQNVNIAFTVQPTTEERTSHYLHNYLFLLNMCMKAHSNFHQAFSVWLQSKDVNFSCANSPSHFSFCGFILKKLVQGEQAQTHTEQKINHIYIKSHVIVGHNQSVKHHSQSVQQPNRCDLKVRGDTLIDRQDKKSLRSLLTEREQTLYALEETNNSS